MFFFSNTTILGLNLETLHIICTDATVKGQWAKKLENEFGHIWENKSH